MDKKTVKHSVKKLRNGVHAIVLHVSYKIRGSQSLDFLSLPLFTCTSRSCCPHVISV